MRALTRIPIFSYKSLVSTLLTDSKSLEIKLRSKFITQEVVTELEDILTWCASHPEVLSIYITVYGDDFIQGFDPEELRTLSNENLNQLTGKISTLAQSLFCLPQTIIMDLKNGTKGIGLELALAADIRIASDKAIFQFDYLEKGVTPVCGLFSYLAPYLNFNIVRSLTLSGAAFDLATLNLMGGFTLTNVKVKELLAQIFNQAPVARMQTKRGLLGNNFSTDVNSKIEVEKQIFRATLKTDDYKKDQNFMNHQEFKEKLQTLG